MLNLSFLIIFAIVSLVLAIFLLFQLLQGAPFLPSHRATVDNMVFLARAKPGEKMADLGSGDGRIVIAFAKAGIEAHGFENNPFLVWWSRWNIRRAGLADLAFIHRKSFWRADFSPYAVVTLFGISHIMRRLERKLQKQLKPGARVISNAFRFPNWELAEKKGSVLMFVMAED